MTYHYNITLYRSLKETRLWTDRIFLLLLMFATAGLLLYNFSSLYLLYAVPVFLSIGGLAMIVSARRKVSIIEISGGNLKYLDVDKDEMVTVPIQDITHISTRFCLLSMHTATRVHSLNLDLVKKESMRWEIKEMIREVHCVHTRKH